MPSFPRAKMGDCHPILARGIPSFPPIVRRENRWLSPFFAFFRVLGLAPRAASPAAEDQERVADELRARPNEDRRAARQASPVLLAAAGGATSEPAAIRCHAQAALGVAFTARVEATGSCEKVGDCHKRPSLSSLESTSAEAAVDCPQHFFTASRKQQWRVAERQRHG